MVTVNDPEVVIANGSLEPLGITSERCAGISVDGVGERPRAIALHGQRKVE
ncbi:MAG: hypothetical protein ACJAR2_003916 [Ilumatobacter sp.]|jgi:hypothetical protein